MQLTNIFIVLSPMHWRQGNYISKLNMQHTQKYEINVGNIVFLFTCTSLQNTLQISSRISHSLFTVALTVSPRNISKRGMRL